MPDAEDSHVTRGALRRRKLRHGFKTHAKRESIKVRREHGIADHEPLDCAALAEALDVIVYRLTELGPSPFVDHLAYDDPGALSALTVVDDGQYAVLINDGHAPERQTSNLAHEVAHIILEHEDAPPLNDIGCREHHADIEAEAEYFGSVLLVPEPAVMRLARANMTVTSAALQFGVSKQMMQWRFNDCGAVKRVERERGR